MRKRILPTPLDKVEKKVMQKLWPYDYNDLETWPWLECKIAGDDIRYISGWIKNPDFKYGHLIKGY